RGIGLTSAGEYHITETTVRDCRGIGVGGLYGEAILIGNETEAPEVTIDSCHLIDNNDGLYINNRASVVMFGSIAAQNQSGNMVVNALNPAHLTVSNSLMQGINRSGDGIDASNGADIT